MCVSTNKCTEPCTHNLRVNHGENSRASWRWRRQCPDLEKSTNRHVTEDRSLHGTLISTTRTMEDHTHDPPPWQGAPWKEGRRLDREKRQTDRRKKRGQEAIFRFISYRRGNSRSPSGTLLKKEVLVGSKPSPERMPKLEHRQSVHWEPAGRPVMSPLPSELIG